VAAGARPEEDDEEAPLRETELEREPEVEVAEDAPVLATELSLESVPDGSLLLEGEGLLPVGEAAAAPLEEEAPLVPLLTLPPALPSAGAPVALGVPPDEAK
jgi:hypothetical protein